DDLRAGLESQPEDHLTRAFHCRSRLVPLMETIRSEIDQAEARTDRAFWPMPSYRELLFGVD
ncbi:MAG: hypothetical protein II704_03525, partial [Erysipelotrichaceae bacterium]|nr:hypothetical protein [Erysipelotrichaceae bacterium]